MSGRCVLRTGLLALGITSAAVAAAAAPAAADGGPVPLPRLFPREAEVTVEAGHLSRLVLPAEVVSACRPDLSDLRLFDAAGGEVPFLLDTGRPAGTRLEAVRRFAAAPLEAARTEEKRTSGPPLRRETVTLAVPPPGSADGAWDLVSTVRAPEFVARVRIEAIGAGGGATMMVDGASLFRLGGARPPEKNRLPLPDTISPRLRVTVESASPAWLEPAFTFESARVLERGGTVAIPLAVLSRRSGEGRTILELERPRGVVPDLLRLGTPTAAFDRVVEVWDGGQGGSGARLGSARLFRVGAPAPSGAEEMPLSPARGDRLRVEIDDGDSPPLEETSFEALVRQPSIVFSLPAVAGAGAGTPPLAVLRFGGGRAHPPRYDLAGLLPPAVGVVAGARAEAEARLFDEATVRPARLGPLRDNPAYDGAPALAFAMHPAAEIDRALFERVRPITVPAAPEGLSRLTLQPEDLSLLKADGSDMRVVDTQGRQWPYLVEREGATVLVGLVLGTPEPRKSGTVYGLQPGYAPLAFDQLLLDTDAGYFDRAFSLEGDFEGKTRPLAQGRLVRPPNGPRAVRIDLPPARVDRMRLVVQDGDDAPIPFRAAQARVVLPAAYVTAPAGEYLLMLGAPDLPAPRYELERVRDVVLAVRSAPITAGPLRANEQHGLAARLKGGRAGQQALLWGTLLAAVAVLSILTLRLARRERKAAVVLLALAGLGAGLSGCAGRDGPSADLIVRGGVVWTGDSERPLAEAVAVFGDRIVAVGRTSEVDPWRGQRTRVIDAAGRLVLPGFNDSHVHFLSGGLGLENVNLKDAPSREEFARRIADRAAALPEGEWVTGGNWDDQAWTPAVMPDATLVDDALRAAGKPDVPVFVYRYDGHMGLANTAAMRLAKVDAKTRDVPGGAIGRDASGRPNGLFRDAAMNLIARAMPPLSPERRLRAIRKALEHAASLGVTSVQDMNPEREDIAVYAELLERGALTTRIYAAPYLVRWKDYAATGVRRAFGSPWLRIGALKGYADGSLGSSTAFFFEPFTDQPSNHGLLSDEETPPVAMLERMMGADAAGLQLCVHAIGDAGISLVLDQFAAVAAAHGPADRRFRIEHAQHMAEKDFARFAAMGVIASMQPYHAVDDGRWAEKRIGPDRIKRTYAFRTFLDRGVRLAFGTDWDVAPLDPLLGLEAAVTRATLDGKNPSGWVPEQKISLPEAVIAYTQGSAYAEFQEKEKGRLAPGMLADLVILDRDIFHVEPQRIHEARVTTTIAGGRVVYEAGAALPASAH
jgi:predicted amidohydrolase YtcJ